MTWGETLGDSDDEDDTSIRSTADSALGEFLTKATLFGLGFHSMQISADLHLARD